MFVLLWGLGRYDGLRMASGRPMNFGEGQALKWLRNILKHKSEHVQTWKACRPERDCALPKSPEICSFCTYASVHCILDGCVPKASIKFVQSIFGTCESTEARWKRSCSVARLARWEVSNKYPTKTAQTGLDGVASTQQCVRRKKMLPPICNTNRLHSFPFILADRETWYLNLMLWVFCQAKARGVRLEKIVSELTESIRQERLVGVEVSMAAGWSLFERALSKEICLLISFWVS